MLPAPHAALTSEFPAWARYGFFHPCYHAHVTPQLPYQIAVLCYLFDEQGRILLLHRRKHPNRDLYSPVGGKLEQPLGESPTACAIREVREETGLIAEPENLHLTGIVSETAYNGETHWLMFLYEHLGPVTVAQSTFDEGRLEWHEPAALATLAIPETDRHVLWPLFWRYRRHFFSAHIDCTEKELKYRLEQPAQDAARVFSKAQ